MLERSINWLGVFGQIAILPFHARWEEGRSKLLQEDVGGPKQAFRRLLAEVAESPDVTGADRSALIASHRSAFDQWSGGGGRAGGLLAGLRARIFGSTQPSRRQEQSLGCRRGTGVDAGQPYE